jgi:hypothetical protein
MASVMAGMWAGSAARNRSMMFLPASPGTAELPTCSAGLPGQLVVMSAIRRLATSVSSLPIDPRTVGFSGPPWIRQCRRELAFDCQVAVSGDQALRELDATAAEGGR